MAQSSIEIGGMVTARLYTFGDLYLAKVIRVVDAERVYLELSRSLANGEVYSEQWVRVTHISMVYPLDAETLAGELAR